MRNYIFVVTILLTACAAPMPDEAQLETMPPSQICSLANQMPLDETIQRIVTMRQLGCHPLERACGRVKNKTKHELCVQNFLASAEDQQRQQNAINAEARERAAQSLSNGAHDFAKGIDSYNYDQKTYNVHCSTPGVFGTDCTAY